MKYKVRIIVKAQCEYEVEVEASSEHEAESIAVSKDREMLPDDFQVNKGYVTDWETDELEQLTHVCVDCGAEYPVGGELKPHPWDYEYCTPCGNKDPELLNLFNTHEVR